MKSLLEENPSELMGLEEENDPMETIGPDEDEEEEPRELMGLGKRRTKRKSRSTRWTLTKKKSRRS